jgi:V-type H+-transporting ATPase subunit a
MTIEGSTGPASIEGWIKLALTGSLWFGCTVGILCLMEVRDVTPLLNESFLTVVSRHAGFLHALYRVEANNKHYEGSGYQRVLSLSLRLSH